MPYTEHELKVKRIEREIAVLCETITKLRSETVEKTERRNLLLDRLKVLTDKEAETNEADG